MVSILLPKNDQPNFILSPAGSHLATCYRIVDLGTQLNSFQGKTKTQHQIFISWELPHEEMEPGKPFTIGKFYNFSTNEKATFRLHLEAWRGRKFTDDELGAFDVAKMIGKGCMLNIMHEPKDAGGVKEKIAAIMSLAKGQQVPPLINKPVVFSLSKEGFSQDIFDSLPNGMREQILKSPEYAELKGFKPLDPHEGDYHGGSHVESMDDMQDVPF